MSTLSKYRELRHNATSLFDCNYIGYRTGLASPVLYQKFAEMLIKRGCEEVWEPFTDGTGKTLDVFSDNGLIPLAGSLESTDDRVIEIDATICKPGGKFDGIFFHPPYFGSSKFSEDERDLSTVTDKDEYFEKFKIAAQICMEILRKNGIVCAVGSRYRINGELIPLDEWLVSVFDRLEILEVWESSPDIAIIMQLRG